MLLRIRQLGVDVGVTVTTPAGETLRTNAPGERTAEELMVISASSDGTYSIEATPIVDGAATGEIELTARVMAEAGALPLAVRYAAAGGRWMAGDATDVCGVADASNPQRAASCFERAADVADEPAWAGRYRYQQADALRAAGAFSDAVAVYSQAITTLPGLDQEELLAAALQARGWTSSRLGDWDAAADDFDAALAILETLRRAEQPHRRFEYDYGDARNNRCIVEQRAGRLQAAQRCFEANAAMVDALEYPAFTSGTYNGLGILALGRGDVDAATDALQEAVSKARDAGARLEQSVALNTLGATWQLAGEFARAIDSYRAALTLYQASGDRSRAAITEANLGMLYRALGDLDRARNSLETALSALIELRESRDIALVRGNLGTVAYEQGDPVAAAKLHREALDYWVAAGSERRAFRARHYLISDLLAQGDVAGAQSHYDAAFVQVPGIEDRPAVAEFRLAAGALALAQSDWGGALERYAQAETDYRAMANGPGLVRAHVGLSRAHRGAGRDADALAFASQAVAGLESLNPGLLTLVERAAYARSRDGVYRHAVSVLMDRPDEERAARALDLARRGKESNLQALIGARDALRADPSFRRLARTVSLRHGELLASRGDEAQFARLRRAYFDALSRLEGHERQLAESEPPTDPTPAFVGVADVAVTYYFSDDSLLAWREADGALSWSNLGSGAELRSSIRAAVDDFHTPALDARTSHADLYQRLLAPFSAIEADRRVSVSPDGPLYLLPFAALPWRDARLLDAFELTIGNASIVDDGPPSRALVVVDPEYGDAPTRGSLRLTPLPNTVAEAKPIVAALGSEDVTVLRGAHASRERFLAAAKPGVQLVHVATHGIFDDRVPAGSGLALSRSQGVTGHEWFVNVHDVARLRLDAGLITLSGCDTARGALHSGEGLVGLTGAFLQAGARQVLSSLWAVSDRSTRALMEAFYDGLLNRGLRPASALRAAQQQIARNRDWQDPYYWAGFAIVHR